MKRVPAATRDVEHGYTMVSMFFATLSGVSHWRIYCIPADESFSL